MESYSQRVIRDAQELRRTSRELVEHSHDLVSARRHHWVTIRLGRYCLHCKTAQWSQELDDEVRCYPRSDGVAPQ